MSNIMEKTRLEKLFGTKPKEVLPIDDKTKEALNNLSIGVDSMIEMGLYYRETSRRKWRL